MNLRLLVPRLAVLALVLAVTVGVLHGLPGIVVSNEFGLRQSLPEQVGSWSGNDVLFCQNEQCLRHFEVPELAGRTNCPVCGSALDDWAPGEKSLLPSDTRLVRKVYRSAGRPPIQVSIVFSGSDQKSIHRPQQCLRGQGLVIENSRVAEVAIPGRQPLRVMFLSVRPQGHGLGDQGLFGYWFVGGPRETPYHLSRLAWMAWDRLIHGRADRWAYVSVYIPQVGIGDNGLDLLRPFLQKMEPRLASTSARAR